MKVKGRRYRTYSDGPSKATIIRLRLELWQAIDDTAEAQGVTQAALIDHVLSEWAANNKAAGCGSPAALPQERGPTELVRAAPHAKSVQPRASSRKGENK